MKFSSLNHTLTRKMEAEYDERHADEKPVEPTFEAPQESIRLTVSTDSSTQLYCLMEEYGSRTDTPSSKGRLRLVGSSEHIEITLPVESIPRIISELQRLHDDMTRYDAEGRAHAERLRRYREDKEAYNLKREKALVDALASGKFTEDQIKYEMDVIPF